VLASFLLALAQPPVGSIEHIKAGFDRELVNGGQRVFGGVSGGLA
jgi:hypothetical protein